MQKLEWHVSLSAKVKMFDEDHNKDKESDRGPKKPPGGFKLPPTTWVAWIAIIGSIVALMLLRDHMATQVGNFTQYDYFQKFQSNLIVQATVNFTIRKRRR